jgi:hypothetical protein
MLVSRIRKIRKKLLIVINAFPTFARRVWAFLRPFALLYFGLFTGLTFFVSSQMSGHWCRWMFLRGFFFLLTIVGNLISSMIPEKEKTYRIRRISAYMDRLLFGSCTSSLVFLVKRDGYVFLYFILSFCGLDPFIFFDFSILLSITPFFSCRDFLCELDSESDFSMSGHDRVFFDRLLNSVYYDPSNTLESIRKAAANKE